MSCFVCTADFTAGKGIVCSAIVVSTATACNFEACTGCIKKYLLDKSHQEPHCMNCKNVWDAGFMSTNFTKYFLMGEYRQKKELALFERDKTHLPMLQAEADRVLKSDFFQRKINKYFQQIQDNYSNEDQLVRDQRIIDRVLREKIAYASRERNNLQTKIIVPEKRAVTMKCSMEKNGEVCRGFLSEKYECGLCHTTICKDCHKQTHIGATHIGAADVEEKHVCDKDDVATVTELKKSTRPCPSCNVPIFKTDGCDQMFCIQCHTAFSWNTGKVDSGVIHNPHYFQSLREGNIRDPRHRNHQGECGPMPNYYIVLSTLNRIYDNGVYRVVREKFPEEKPIEHYFQVFQHHRVVTLQRFLDRDGGLEQIRVGYLTGKYTEKQYKQKLFVLDQSQYRKREEQQIMETFVTIGEEYFRNLVSHYTHRKQLEEMVREINTLIQVTKHSMQLLNEKYTHVGLHGLVVDNMSLTNLLM